jgi:hypothetical protein
MSFAKKSFANLKESSYESRYIKNKRVSAQFCDINCNKSFNSYEDYLSFSINSRRYPNILNKRNNLISNLYSKEVLTDVDVLENATTGVTPTDITYGSTPIYEQYNIDPSGLLFGKTGCGINNYLNFVKFSLQK